jgi:hypothetical protein
MRRTVLLLAACGRLNGGDPVTLDQLPDRVAAATCSKAFACCSQAELAQMFGGLPGNPTTEPECEASLSQLFATTTLPAFQASIDGGRAVYDPDNASTCLDVVASESCAEFSASLGGVMSCVLVLPAVAPGGSCAATYECMTQDCQGASGSGNPDGSCVPLPGPGDPCTDICQAGLFCGSNPGGMLVCAPQGDVGAPCKQNQECRGEVCMFDPMGIGTCGPPQCTSGG